MKLPVAVVAAFPLVAAGMNHHHLARQAFHTSSGTVGTPSTNTARGSSLPPPTGLTSTSTISSTTSMTSVSSITGAPPVSGLSMLSNSSSVPNATLATNFPFSLDATNPTAVPLASITANASSAATIPLASTAVPGATPTFLNNAPPLPNAALLSPANYPALDRLPPTDSPEVQQWIQEVANSGIPIPDFAPTVPGGCPANPDAAANSSRCWWTCNGCTAATDVVDCPQPLQWGLTYDDGPGYYTTQLLDFLDHVGLKSTMFVVGSRVISFPAILQAEYMGGHHIAVHTWSHPYLTTLTNEQIIAELGWSKKVIKDVLGVTPNMMRPPYGDIDNRVRAISLAMGLRPVIWTRISANKTFDTGDYFIPGGKISVQEVLYNWENIMANVLKISTGFIVLEHDLWQQTVEVATGYILPDAINRNLSIQPIISCLKKPMSDAYIETNDNATNPPPVAIGSTLLPSSPTGKPGSSRAENLIGGNVFGFGVALEGTVAAVLAMMAGAAAVAL